MLLLLLLLATVVAVAAQQTPVAPLPVSGPSYVKHKNKFYIYGGNGDAASGYRGQFFALDLSKTWKSTSPAWIQLPDGPKKAYFGASMSLDGKLLMSTATIYSPAHLFSFESNTWILSKAVFRESMEDVYPVTLGTDGSVLLAGGHPGANGSALYDVYSFKTDKTVTANLPPTGADGLPYLPGRREYRVAWSEHLKSAVYYGGLGNNVPVADTVSFYNPASKQWKAMKTTGYNNVSLSEHCMALTDDGKKAFVYGGSYSLGLTTLFSADLYILDLVTGAWTVAAYLNSKRGYSACTIAGDYFLLWGGRNAIGVNGTIDIDKPSTPVYIYQISLNAWVNDYTPSLQYRDLVPTSSSGSSSPTSPISPGTTNPLGADQASDNKLNIGGIAGGIAGALIIVALVGFLVWRRKRQAKRLSQQQDSAPSHDNHSDYASDDKRYNIHMHDAMRMPQVHPQTAVSRAPHYPHDHGSTDDYAEDARESGGKVDVIYAAKNSTPSSAPAPHYPSWGANINDPFVADGSHYGYDTSSVSSQDPSQSNSRRPSPYSPASSASSSHGDLSPPRPLLRASPPALSRPRNPQSLEHRHMLRQKLERSQVPDGRWSDERPGPQWHPQ